MPNWCETNLVITGPSESLDELEKQMKQPYQVITQDWTTKEIKEQTTEGEFLLWNIIRPLDTDTYFGLAEMKAEQDKLVIAHLDPDPFEAKDEVKEVIKGIEKKIENFHEDILTFAEQFHNDIQTKEDWYHWNIRNWGTKWEIANAQPLRNKPTELIYDFSTAWSPCAEAIDKLSAQYPMLAFTMRAIDEGMAFACEIHWADGVRAFDMDLDITHDLVMDLYGECSCEWDDSMDDSDRAEKGCPAKEVE